MEQIINRLNGTENNCYCNSIVSKGVDYVYILHFSADFSRGHQDSFILIYFYLIYGIRKLPFPFYFASAPVIAMVEGIMFSGCPSIPFS